MKDDYVYDMDWSGFGNGFNTFSNYRKYQFDLIKNYLGKNILEIGTGDRSFTAQVYKYCRHDHNLLSIEPSETLFDLYKNEGSYANNYQFISLDLFKMGNDFNQKFDTVLLVHVLEHIKEDRKALAHIHSLLSTGGRLLIQVPAFQWLFSNHDISIGHYRRYNKKALIDLIDPKMYKVVKIWYQDPIGILGSLYFFKWKKTKLKSEEGRQLISTQGYFYDRYLIPIESFLEKFINFPFGLNLTIVLEKI